MIRKNQCVANAEIVQAEFSWTMSPLNRSVLYQRQRQRRRECVCACEREYKTHSDKYTCMSVYAYMYAYILRRHVPTWHDLPPSTPTTDKLLAKHTRLCGSCRQPE